MEDKQKDSFDKYEELINEFVSQRDAIKQMIVDLEKIKQKIDTLLPESLDRRFVRFFEEKVKSITEVFRVMLDLRKEIIKNTKDEIELRKRYLNNDDDDLDIDGLFNIKKLADKVEKMRKETLGIEHKIVITESVPEEPKKDDFSEILVDELELKNKKGE